MKWYNHRIHKAHLDDLKTVKQRLGAYDVRNVEHIYEHIRSIAHSFNRDYSRIGVVDLNDLIQEGYSEMLYAWTKVKWDEIDASENPAGQLWTYLKVSIKRGMIRAIMDNRSSIRIPRQYYTTRHSVHRKEYQTDIFLSNTFTAMFGDDYFDVIDEIGNYSNDQLNDFLNNLMDKIMTFKEKDILKKMYGIDEHLDKKVSVKDIAEYYRMSEIGVKKSKRRALSKMILNKEIIQKYIDERYT